MTMKTKNSNDSKAKRIGKKILQIVYLLLKPFIPYIMIFLFVFFFIILIIDAIFIQFSDDTGELSISESELEEYCEKASSSNYEVYLDGEQANGSISISSTETQKAITWEQIYSLLLFNNLCEDKEITTELVDEISNDFKSKYYYKTSKIVKENKVIDENGNESWQVVSEETTNLITESITIAGHYVYNYAEETTEERRY